MYIFSFISGVEVLTISRISKEKKRMLLLTITVDIVSKNLNHNFSLIEINTQKCISLWKILYSVLRGVSG